MSSAVTTHRQSRYIAVGLALALPALPAQANAQSVSVRPAATEASRTEAPIVRAQRLVSEGMGIDGRRIIDSLLAATPISSSDYPEALFWRASLATTAAEAERDYVRLTSEFPLSPRVEDALIRLSQLELARGERAAALRHLERLVLEHPDGAARPRASYWMARILVEQNELPRACVALEMARTRATAAEAELRNQIDVLAGRCAGVDTTGRAIAANVQDSARSRAPNAAPPVASAHPPMASALPSATPSAGGVASRTVPPPRIPTPVPSTSASSAAFSVQVGAFDTRSPAARLVERLTQRGHDARVVGDRAPYRVRIGRYPTRAQALTAAAALKQRGMDGWVVAAEPR